MAERPTAPRRRKRWLILFGTLLITVLLVVALLLPYLLKRYIETHSEEWINRKVTIDRIILNPFTFRYAVTIFSIGTVKRMYLLRGLKRGRSDG